jgi:hypothetical protein
VAGLAPSAGSSLFKPLPTPTPTAAARSGNDPDIPVKLTVELGRTRITIKHLLQLARYWRWTAWRRTDGRAVKLPDRPGRSGGGQRQVRHPPDGHHHPSERVQKLNR